MQMYIIKHRATGKIMPLMKRNRGYSHWNPSIPDKTVYSQTEIPRLLLTRKQAERVIHGWYNCPNSRNDYDGDLCLGPMDNRKKEDLQIVKVIISIQRVKEDANQPCS